MVPAFVQFLAMYLIAGFLIRIAQLALVAKRDSALGKALAFIH